jgi:hypothetical protein
MVNVIFLSVVSILFVVAALSVKVIFGKKNDVSPQFSGMSGGCGCGGCGCGSGDGGGGNLK